MLAMHKCASRQVCPHRGCVALTCTSTPPCAQGRDNLSLSCTRHTHLDRDGLLGAVRARSVSRFYLASTVVADVALSSRHPASPRLPPLRRSRRTLTSTCCPARAWAWTTPRSSPSSPCYRATGQDINTAFHQGSKRDIVELGIQIQGGQPIATTQAQQRFDRHRIADHAQRAAQRTLPSSALGRRRDASSCCDERLQRARPCAERGQARQRRSAVHTRPCPRSRPARPSFRPREYCYATPYARPDRPTSRPDRQLDTVLAQHCIPNHPTLLRTDSALQV